MKSIFTILVLIMMFTVNAVDVEINGKLYKNCEFEKIYENSGEINIIYDGGIQKVYIGLLPEEIQKQIKAIKIPDDVDFVKAEKEYNETLKELDKLRRRLKIEDLFDYQKEAIIKKITDLEQKNMLQARQISKFQDKDYEKGREEDYKKITKQIEQIEKRRKREQEQNVEKPKQRNAITVNDI